jgi:integrase
MPDTELAFEKIAREWHDKQVWNPKHAKNILRTLEVDVFPYIGKKPIIEVNAQDILKILRIIEERNALDVAKRVNQRCTAIFDYAIVKGICDNNPATGRAKIIKARKVKHRPHLTEEQLPEFLNALENYRGTKKVKLAMKLLLLTFVRPGELRHARWEEIDEEKAEWRISAERMKMKRPHIVPLSTQALELLNELKGITGKSALLFPSSKKPNVPISDVTLTKLLIILGYVGDKKIVPHGMRATASTILNEKGQFRPDVIERQLAHIEKNKVRAAYHHAEYLDERKTMMQWWGDYLDKLADKF